MDGHCHIEQVTGSWTSLDDFETATIAALWGGTTTVIDFGIPADRGESPLEAAENKMRLAKAARCGVALHGAVTAWDDSVPWQLKRLAGHGIQSVKLYTTNRHRAFRAHRGHPDCSDPDADRQFDHTSMVAAAELLRTADVDVLAWNGTAGSWLGPDQDRETVQRIQGATGVPATTSTLAYLDAQARRARARVSADRDDGSTPRSS